MRNIAILFVLLMVHFGHFAEQGKDTFWYTGQLWPFCTAKSQDCETYGFDYVKSESCLLGQKVLCKLKDPRVRPTFSPANQLNVMTYNIHEMPHIVTTKGQVERTCRIPRELYRHYPDMDVIFVQELFMDGCLDGIDMRTLMAHYGWKYSTKTLFREIFWFKTVGGVAIFSKYPLENMQYHIFYTKNIGRIDSLSPKGFVYANMMKDNRTFHLIGTHLAAWNTPKINSIRYKQGRQIASLLDSLKIPYEEPTILGGDLNFDYNTQKEEIMRFFEITKFNMLPIEGDLKTTFDSKTNNLVEDEDENDKWYDYIAIRTTSIQPVKGSMQSVTLRNDNAFNVCVKPSMSFFSLDPDSCFCWANQYIQDLSDHFPVIARLEFPSQ